MDITLKMEKYRHQALVCAGSAAREVSEEFVVPDAMPDIGAIVDAEGVLTLRSKDTEAGWVQMNASIAVSVLYQPEDGGSLRALEVNLPADVRVEASGADGECRTAARLRIRSLDARAVHARKIAVRAELEAEASCYRAEDMELASGLDGEGSGAHLLTKTAEAVLVTDVREKTFAATDEYQMPAGAGDILSRRVEATVEDVKLVGGKVVFRGRVRSELLFEGEDGGVAAGRYETEYSQLMEVDTEDAEALAEVSLMLTGAYFDPPEYGQGRLAAEFHFAAQCVCRERRELAYIADIYSNRTLLVPRTESVPVVTQARHVTLRQTVAGRAEPQTADVEVVSVSASVGGVQVEAGTVRTSVSVRVITRRRDGAYASSRCRLTAEFSSPELGESTALSGVTVTATDVYAAGTDVRAALQMDALAADTGALACVMDADEDAEGWKALPAAPSATLLHVPSGTELWQLARRYRSTPEAIAAANEGRTEGLLLIPKAR